MSKEKIAGKVIKETLYLHAFRRDDGSYGFQTYTFDASNLENNNYILVDTKEIEMTVPEINEIDLDQKTIERMKEEQQKILADAQLKANNIEEQIQNMLCISHDN